MNVVMIVTDTMRIDDLACYRDLSAAQCGSFAHLPIQTPNLDRLAEEGTRFTRYYTEGLPTIPSRLAYATGRYSLPFRGWEPLRPDDVLLQEILWENGYLTGFVTDTYHLFRQSMGYGRGFGFARCVRGREQDPWMMEGDVSDAVEKYYRDPDDGETLSHWYTREAYAQYLRNRLPWEAADGWKDERHHFAYQVADTAVQWLASQQQLGLDDKLFLWMDIFAPHTPLDPPAPYDRMYVAPGDTCKDILVPRVGRLEGFCSEEELEHIRRLRAGFVTFVDKCVGHVVDWLRESGMLDNTLLVYVSDHGDFFGEHGILMKCRPWPYDILSHVPLIVRPPEGAGGSTAETFAQSCDLMPTILDFVGMAPPESVQGTSLLPALSDPSAMLRASAIAGNHRASQSIRNADWSYYEWLGDAQGKGEGPELYNLEQDPAETNNAIEENPEVAADLRAELHELLASLRSSGRRTEGPEQ